MAVTNMGVTFNKLAFCVYTSRSSSTMLLENFTYSLNRWSCIFSHCPFERTKKNVLYILYAGPILEGKGMRAIFQKKCKERAKYLKTWAKMYKFENLWKYFEKGQPHETVRICPEYALYIYIYIYVYIYMAFTAEGILEVATESWPQWNLNPWPLNSVQTMRSNRPQSQLCRATPISSLC